MRLVSGLRKVEALFCVCVDWLQMSAAPGKACFKKK